MGHILSETIYLFSYCVFSLNIYPKIKSTAKHLSDLCNFYIEKWFFGILKTNFLLFFAEFEILMLHNNIVKLSEKLNKWNFWKSASKLPILQISAQFAFTFAIRKNEDTVKPVLSSHPWEA